MPNLQILFGGFFIKITQIPEWIRWAQVFQESLASLIKERFFLVPLSLVKEAYNYPKRDLLTHLLGAVHLLAQIRHQPPHDHRVRQRRL